MAEKARLSSIPLRPHFKTHQSLEIGRWFRNAGVDRITVSSVSMAEFFAADGWNDITIAFPVNILEADRIDALAADIRLGVLVDNEVSAEALNRLVAHPLSIWIKIDTGYNRAGILWTASDSIRELAELIASPGGHSIAGLLTHAGQSYTVSRREEHARLFALTAGRMQEARTALPAGLRETCLISVGDTPTCSAVDLFGGVDEVRPGNFVFFDVQQLRIGSCRENDIAAAVICPVVGVYPERGEAILYGGGVHLSKQAEKLDGEKSFHGYVVSWDGSSWGPVKPDHYLKSLSQEHGIVHYGPDIPVKPGDLVAVLPVHSCLAMNLLKESTVILE
jgi:D-serine deaminase-like pyridoxal phosphate-dependent protein